MKTVGSDLIGLKFGLLVGGTGLAPYARLDNWSLSRKRRNSSLVLEGFYPGCIDIPCQQLRDDLRQVSGICAVKY